MNTNYSQRQRKCLTMHIYTNKIINKTKIFKRQIMNGLQKYDIYIENVYGRKTHFLSV